jgi:hypothetical protein
MAKFPSSHSSYQEPGKSHLEWKKAMNGYQHQHDRDVRITNILETNE